MHDCRATQLFQGCGGHHLTQSAVSQAMQHLEESVGVQLIDRSKRPLVLTAAGKTYLSGLRGILRSYERLEREVRSTSKQLSGQITVGTIVSVGLSYMPEASEAFARLHPEVDVKTEFGTNDRVFEMTTEGEVDFGLVSFPRSTKQLQYVLWQQEPMRIVCSAEHPLAAQHEVTLSQLASLGHDRFRPRPAASPRDRSVFGAGRHRSQRADGVRQCGLDGSCDSSQPGHWDFAGSGGPPRNGQWLVASRGVSRVSHDASSGHHLPSIGSPQQSRQ